MNLHEIQQYTKKLGLTFTMEDCQEVAHEAVAGETVQDAVWWYLDQYEGVCHSRDPEYWRDREEVFGRQ